MRKVYCPVVGHIVGLWCDMTVAFHIKTLEHCVVSVLVHPGIEKKHTDNTGLKTNDIY